MRPVAVVVIGILAAQLNACHVTALTSKSLIDMPVLLSVSMTYSRPCPGLAGVVPAGGCSSEFFQGACSKMRVLISRPPGAQPVATVETDRYGQVKLTLPPGRYEARVTFPTPAYSSSCGGFDTAVTRLYQDHLATFVVSETSPTTVTIHESLIVD